jgi:hypothetical protein
MWTNMSWPPSSGATVATSGIEPFDRPAGHCFPHSGRMAGDRGAPGCGPVGDGVGRAPVCAGDSGVTPGVIGPAGATWGLRVIPLTKGAGVGFERVLLVMTGGSFLVVAGHL